MNKPNRNDPCPCGSGKKFKKCCALKEGRRKMQAAKVPTTMHSNFLMNRITQVSSFNKEQKEKQVEKLAQKISKKQESSPQIEENQAEKQEPIEEKQVEKQEPIEENPPSEQKPPTDIPPEDENHS